MTQYIDVTPTWESILPTMRLIIEHHENEDSREAMWKDLANMARAADRWNAHVRENEVKAPPLFTSRRSTAAAGTQS